MSQFQFTLPALSCGAESGEDGQGVDASDVAGHGGNGLVILGIKCLNDARVGGCCDEQVILPDQEGGIGRDGESLKPHNIHQIPDFDGQVGGQEDGNALSAGVKLDLGHTSTGVDEFVHFCVDSIGFGVVIVVVPFLPSNGIQYGLQRTLGRLRSFFDGKHPHSLANKASNGNLLSIAVQTQGILLHRSQGNQVGVAESAIFPRVFEARPSLPSCVKS